MRKVAKIGLSCLLALTVAAPVVAIPGAIEAAPKKATAKKSYTTAERAYIKYQSDTLYKLRTQTEDLIKLLEKYDEYENKDAEKFVVLFINKVEAWDKTLKQTEKYRPQDVSGTLKKAHSFFTEARKHNLAAYQLLSNTILGEEDLSDAQVDKEMDKFFKEYALFKGKAGSFNEEINRLNKIYK
ncbi:hypothetical protein P9597_05920 [Aneurinibacillus migulanus]|uniref:hypothetical protein n=1 Tax=Aneurinibacillus migulanus TaxID=47500 RepID=UPI002E225ECE|nr:hypothetical protein [Aneurinibacillus migulanus]